MSEKTALEHLAEMDAQRAEFLQWWENNGPKLDASSVTMWAEKQVRAETMITAWKAWLAARGVKV